MYILWFRHVSNNCGTTVYTWGFKFAFYLRCKEHNYKHSWTWESENRLDIKKNKSKIGLDAPDNLYVSLY